MKGERGEKDDLGDLSVYSIRPGFQGSILQADLWRLPRGNRRDRKKAGELCG